MSSNQNKTLRIEVEPGVYKEIEQFCIETGTSKNELMAELLQYFLKDGKHMLDTMRKGYMEMARINLEICSEFDEVEAEVASLI